MFIIDIGNGPLRTARPCGVKPVHIAGSLVLVKPLLKRHI